MVTGCARSAMMLDGETSEYVDVFRGIVQGCTPSPILFNVDDLILATKLAKREVKVGEDAPSGLIFADH